MIAVLDRSNYALFFFVHIFICALSVRDRVSSDATFLLCSPGQGPAVFETWVELGTRGIVLPQLSLCHLSLLSEWSGSSEGLVETEQSQGPASMLPNLN